MRKPSQHLLIVFCLSTAVATTFVIKPQKGINLGATPEVDVAPESTRTLSPSMTSSQPSITQILDERQKRGPTTSHQYSSSRQIRTEAENAKALEVFARFDRWIDDYLEDARGEGAESIVAKGHSLALARRSAMARLIESDPQEAIHRAVPFSVRKNLPSSITQHLENKSVVWASSMSSLTSGDQVRLM